MRYLTGHLTWNTDMDLPDGAEDIVERSHLNYQGNEEEDAIVTAIEIKRDPENKECWHPILWTDRREE